MSSISFGMWSTSLLLGSAHGVIGAGLLLWAPHNRIANRCLAALLLVVVALITPYTLGYAGAYDAYPDLTYAPLFWELAIGPLVWLYVRQLARAHLPRRWALHLLPALLQGGYYAPGCLPGRCSANGPGTPPCSGPGSRRCRTRWCCSRSACIC